MKKENVEFIGLFNEENWLHITLKYYGVSPLVNRESIELFKNLIGKEFHISLIGHGEYEKDGVILNKGYLVDKDSLSFPIIPEVPHITTYVNIKKGGKAKDTKLCVFKALDTPIIMKMRLGVCRFGKIEYTLED